MSGPGQPITPILSAHARQRCLEMQVLTKRVKRIVRNPDTVWSTVLGRYKAVSDADPELMIVYAIAPDGTCTIITVLYRQHEYYQRPAT